MVFEDLALGILRFANYGITIVTIMLIFEIFRFFFHGKSDGIKDYGKKFVDPKEDWLMTKMGWNNKGKRINATKAMNQFIAEETEEKMLRDAVEYIEKAVNGLEIIGSKLKIDSENERNEVIIDLSKAEEEINKVKATYRSNYGLNDIINKAQKSEIDVSNLESLERKNLKLHKEVADEINKSLEFLRNIKKDNTSSFVNFKNIKHAEFPFIINNTSSFSKTHLSKLIKWLKRDETQLKSAFEKLEEAKAQVQGIIAEVRKFHQ
jgi:hypothetical protein